MLSELSVSSDSMCYEAYGVVLSVLPLSSYMQIAKDLKSQVSLDNRTFIWVCGLWSRIIKSIITWCLRNEKDKELYFYEGAKPAEAWVQI